MAPGVKDAYASTLKDKVVIVTGAASGFGKLLSESLVQYDAKVLLVDIDPLVQQVAESLDKQDKGAAHWHQCDLCQLEAIKPAFDSAVERFGHVDVLMNNAGIMNKTRFFDQTDSKELEQLIRLNLLAPMEATRIAARYFKESGRQGVVVNSASVGGVLPVSFLDIYGTSKAGLIYFTASCKGLAPQVRVSAIAPYFADTPLVSNSAVFGDYPLLLKAGLVSPEEVVAAMLRSICDKSLAGETLIVAPSKKPKRLTIFDATTSQVSFQVVGGLAKKRVLPTGKAVRRALDWAVKVSKKSKPAAPEQA
ncbi:hypothetical protein GGF46_005291 [Coemansia sp. RSA 552]|nr:hypothetical protein GGF46_005291 [Coemansia sp. RSA 552]